MRVMRAPGVRGRLALGATTFIATAVAVSLLAGRWVIAVELDQADQRLLQADLTQVAQEYREHARDGDDGDRTRRPPSGLLVAVRDASGADTIDTLPAAVDAARSAHAVGDTFTVASGESTWLVGSSTIDGGATAWVARDVSASSETLELVDRYFLAGGALLVLLFSLAAVLFVRAVLRPLEVLRERERRMVSDAAHELRTPLAGLRGQLEHARRSVTDPDAARAELRRAEDSVARLGDLASNLLELARVEEQPAPGHATLDAVVEAFLTAVDDVRAAPESAGIAVEQVSDLAPGAGAVAVDAVSFRRIMLNLLSNAVRAASGTVTARLSRDDRTLVVDVTDDGPGMGEEFLGRALERFTREYPSDGTGSGLGLALVDALARAAGGGVALANTHPGLRVTVRLPLR